VSTAAQFAIARGAPDRPVSGLDRYFAISLYLLAATAFVGLVASGGVGITTAILAGSAFAARGFQLVRRDASLLPERWATVAAIAYFAFFIADYWFLSRTFLPPIVHLVLFAAVIRLFTLRRDRDHVTLAVLSFLMILAAAIFTVDSLFLLCFAAFLLVAIVTFVLMEMRHSQRSSTLPELNQTREARRLPALLMRIGPALMFLTLVFGTGIFFLLPRRSAGYLGAYSFGTDFSTGFSSKVQLGQIGRIQQSDAVAMHIQIDGDTDGSHDLYWRGISLSQFDGTNWFSPFRPEDGPIGLPVGPSLGATFDIPRLCSGRGAGRLEGSRLIHYRVLLEPIGTNVFFVAPWVQRVKGPYRGLFATHEGTIENMDVDSAIGRYEADSDTSAPSPDELRRAPAGAADPTLQMYLDLPALDSRVAPLAASVTASSTNSYDKARQLESYLRTHYGYTLQLPSQPVKDPVANFLFERKQGHCEYFASSMAVMLRSLGIPSRMVNGFHGGEFNRLTGDYIIRARDAHSWVEAYFPGEGWVAFDPTPAAATGARSLSRIALYLDAMSSFWRDWVVSYDKGQQLALGKTALQTSRDKMDALRRWSRRQYRAMLVWAENLQHALSESQSKPTGRIAMWTKVSAATLLLALALAGWAVWRRPRHLAKSDPPQAAAIWYTQMTRMLARRGYQKAPAQTAHDFAGCLPDGPLQRLVSEFTDTYLAARFGSSTGAAVRLPDLLKSIRTVARS